MKIKSAKSFRFWYKTKVKEINKNDTSFNNYNENFVGTYHEENGKKIKGFFEMYHGDKPDIAGYLPSILKIAEDGQAIYEFLQNAVDCNSTHFYIFYNEKFFIAINNGSPFEIDGLKSILNIAQSTKKEADKIGRFGIGFKLAHRLVGKNEGAEELTQQYKGPVLFSWSKLEDLQGLINKEKIEAIFPSKNNLQQNNEYKSAPYLLKLVLTNFPTEPNEIVKDLKYKDNVLFPQNELDELSSFLKENFDKHSESLNLNYLKQGSLFFIKLGEGKKSVLDRDYDELVNGIQYSMNMLKNLKEVYINENHIDKIRLWLDKGRIPKDSETFQIISPEYKEFDIQFSVGYPKINFGGNDAFERIKEIKKSPNFYKYFPMGDENNGFGFIIHCDSFSNEANRRKLQHDEINNNLFPELSKFIINKLKKHRNNIDESHNRLGFLNLYVSLLLSDIPDKQNNIWLRTVFYDKILDYLKTNIPTTNGYSNNSQNVKINKLNLDLNLSDFGLEHIQWFEWDKETEKLIIDEAEKVEKLGIKSWKIVDIVENADLRSINNWIANSDKQTYTTFLNELEESYLRRETKEKICQIKLFKFSDDEYYSFNEIVKKDNLPQSRTIFNYGFTNIIFRTSKNEEIANELEKLGIILSEINTSVYQNIFSSIERMPDEKQMYNIIAEKCKTNTLSPLEKKKLFLNFINETTKFDNVAEGTLKDLTLFCDRNSEIKPISKLIGNIKTPNWLNRYKVQQDEYFSELDSFLISESEDIFKEIYQQNQKEILTRLTTVEEIKSLIKLYQDNQKSFFKEFIIRKDNNIFIIDKKTSETYQVQSADKDARNFIDENCADYLFALPYEFVDNYKDEEGIIKADDLHNLILDLVDVDEHKEILVEIVKYKAKYKFFQELSEFRFNSEVQYTKEDYEYKLLDLACSELKESDSQNFKDKVVIETKQQNLKLSEIPPFIDKIKINDCELSLAKILPDNYGNSDHLSSLINQFISLGLNKERIGNLFGVTEEPEPSDIFQMFSEKVETLENAEQLAFLLLHGKQFDINFEKFKVETLDEKSWELKYTYYIKPYSFIGEDYLLKNQYAYLNDLIPLPSKIGISDNIITEKPYLADNKFVCPCIKSDLTDEEKTELIEFIYSQWNKDTQKEKIKKIDWSKIGEEESQKILCFNPKYSVFPNEYACENEQLPNYLIEWVGTDENKISFISDLGVWTEKSSIVDLRKFWKDGESFNSNLERETRFDNDETMLFNSFEWLRENDYRLSTNEQFEILEKVVQVINASRKGKGDLIIQSDFDFESLGEISTVWNTPYYNTWKESLDNKFTIYLCDDHLSKTVKLDEISDYIFYCYNSGDIAINENNQIYINRNTDIKTALSSLISKENDFTAEDLLLLYQSKETSQTENDEVDELKSEVERLRQRIAELEAVSSTASYSPTIVSYDDYHDTIKEKSEQYLYDFLKSNNTKVKWLNYNEIDNCFIESWANHDFEILDSDGNIKHYIDCKGTPHQKRTFYLTDNEWVFFLNV